MATKKRIGVHVGTTGGVWTAVDRAVAAGANTFQIFSSSPRMWKGTPVKAADAAKMKELRAKNDVGPDHPISGGTVKVWPLGVGIKPRIVAQPPLHLVVRG